MNKRPRLTTLKSRLGVLPSQIGSLRAGGWRTDGMTTSQRGYGAAWQKARARFLEMHPLCAMCQSDTPPRITAATVVDHRIAHKGNQSLFWDESNWQSLCATHHSSDKQRQERGGRERRRVGNDGWPVE